MNSPWIGNWVLDTIGGIPYAYVGRFLIEIKESLFWDIFGCRRFDQNCLATKDVCWLGTFSIRTRDDDTWMGRLALEPFFYYRCNV